MNEEMTRKCLRQVEHMYYLYVLFYYANKMYKNSINHPFLFYQQSYNFWFLVFFETILSYFSTYQLYDDAVYSPENSFTSHFYR